MNGGIIADEETQKKFNDNVGQLSKYLSKFWISCADEMPPEKQQVLAWFVCDKYSYKGVASFELYNGYMRIFTDDDDFLVKKEKMWWMPLPDAPEGKND